jgi:sugar lactone lactonase YvrE
VKFPSGVLLDPHDDGVVWLVFPGMHEIGRLEDGWLDLPYGAPEAGYAGDGGPVILARFAYPSSIAFDDDGALYVSDRMNQVVRRIRDGLIETIAGTPLTAGFAGDGGPAEAALLSARTDERLDPGNRLDVRGTRLVVADTGNSVVREVDLASGTIRTLADGFLEPHDVVVAPDGTVYASDTGAGCVKAIDPDGGVAVVAGRCGERGPFESGLAAVDATFESPTGLGLGPDGALWITDTWNHVVVRIPEPY